MKTIFTTGQIAKICKVAPRTVSKWFDSGRLKGYRIPDSQDRRIPKDALVQFLKEAGMPLGELASDRTLLTMRMADQQRSELAEALGSDFSLEVLPETASLFEVGSRFSELKPLGFIVTVNGSATAELVHQMRQARPEVVIVGLHEVDGQFDRTPYTETFRLPCEMALVANRILRHVPH